jgi:hypothetical protein
MITSSHMSPVRTSDFASKTIPKELVALETVFSAFRGAGLGLGLEVVLGLGLGLGLGLLGSGRG